MRDKAIHTNQWCGSTSGGAVVYAKWWGGLYADLSFERDGTVFEVLSMRNAAGELTPFTADAFAERLRTWGATVSDGTLNDRKAEVGEG